VRFSAWSLSEYGLELRDNADKNCKRSSSVKALEFAETNCWMLLRDAFEQQTMTTTTHLLSRRGV